MFYGPWRSNISYALSSDCFCFPLNILAKWNEIHAWVWFQLFKCISSTAIHGCATRKNFNWNSLAILHRAKYHRHWYQNLQSPHRLERCWTSVHKLPRKNELHPMSIRIGHYFRIRWRLVAPVRPELFRIRIHSPYDRHALWALVSPMVWTRFESIRICPNFRFFSDFPKVRNFSVFRSSDFWPRDVGRGP